MASDTATVSSLQVQTSQATSLHEAAWPDMLTNLHVAYADLTRTQLELEQRATEIDETRKLFERVIESMSEALFLMDTVGRILRVNGAAAALLERQSDALLGQPFAAVCTTADIPSTPWQLLARAPHGILPIWILSFVLQPGTPSRSTSPADSSATSGARSRACW